MNYEGILIGVGAFVIIGALHPVVIKTEYHFGKRVWPAFLAAGLACCAASLFLPGFVLPALAAVLGCSLLWSIRELYEQEERVKKGWFPANPHKRCPERKEGAPAKVQGFAGKRRSKETGECFYEIKTEQSGVGSDVVDKA